MDKGWQQGQAVYSWGAVKYSAYESDIIIKVNSTEMTENIVVLDEIIHKWLYPSIKEGQNYKCKMPKIQGRIWRRCPKKADGNY